MTRWGFNPMLTRPQRPVNGPDACVFHLSVCSLIAFWRRIRCYNEDVRQKVERVAFQLAARVKTGGFQCAT